MSGRPRPSTRMGAASGSGLAGVPDQRPDPEVLGDGRLRVGRWIEAFEPGDGRRGRAVERLALADPVVEADDVEGVEDLGRQTGAVEPDHVDARPAGSTRVHEE